MKNVYVLLVVDLCVIMVCAVDLSKAWQPYKIDICMCSNCGAFVNLTVRQYRDTSTL